MGIDIIAKRANLFTAIDTHLIARDGEVYIWDIQVQVNSAPDFYRDVAVTCNAQDKDDSPSCSLSLLSR